MQIKFLINNVLTSGQLLFYINLPPLSVPISIARTSIQEAHSFLAVTKATELLNHNDNVEMYVKGHTVDRAMKKETTVQLMKCPRKEF